MRAFGFKVLFTATVFALGCGAASAPSDAVGEAEARRRAMAVARGTPLAGWGAARDTSPAGWAVAALPALVEPGALGRTAPLPRRELMARPTRGLLRTLRLRG